MKKSVVSILFLASFLGSLALETLVSAQQIPTPIETPQTDSSPDRGIKDAGVKGSGKYGITGRTKGSEESVNTEPVGDKELESENTSSSDAAKAAGIPGIKAKSVRKQSPQ